MKRIYFALVSAVAILFATDAQAQLSVGVGYNHEAMSEVYVGVRDTDRETEGLDGFYMEATYDFNFLKANWGMLAIQPGVRFSFAGDSESDEEYGYRMKTTFNETYLDIPVLVKYSYPMGSVKLSAFAGPIASIGLTSSKKISLKGEGVDSMSKVNMYTTVSKPESAPALDVDTDSLTTDYGRFDLKLGVGVGASLNDKFNVKIGYNIGLLNRYTGALNYRLHTGMFYAGVGISF